MATPVLAELKAVVLGFEQRMARCTHHALEVRRTRLSAAARGLPKPQDMLGLASQRFDLAAGRLGAALERNAAAHERDLVRISLPSIPRIAGSATPPEGRARDRVRRAATGGERAAPWRN